MKASFSWKLGSTLLICLMLAVGGSGQASIPASPNSVSATAGNTEVALRWIPVSGATSYHVKRSTTAGGPYTQIAAPTFAGYTDVSRQNGTMYYYVVSAANSLGESPNSAQVSAKPAATVSLPTAPVNLTAAAGNALVGLRWAPTTSATVYHLKRSTINGGPYIEVASPTWYGYTDVGVKNGTTYFYVVSAVTNAGESVNSAQAIVTPTGPAPVPTITSVTITPAIASSITSGTLPFTASVQGTSTNKAVTWKAALGTITSSGLYTAPSKAGTDTVTATSNADPTKSDSTVVKVTAASTAPPPDPPPPPAPSGAGLADAFFSLSYTQIEASHYPSVPFGGVRLWDTNTTWAQIETSRGSYNWTDLDIWLRNIASHGQDAMYTFGRVPHWASSQPSQSCAYAVSDPGCAAPTADLNSGDNIWKEFVTAVVKHSLSSPGTSHSLLRDVEMNRT